MKEKGKNGGWKKKRGRISRGIYMEGKKAEVGEKKKVKGRLGEGGKGEGYMDRSTCVQMRISK